MPTPFDNTTLKDAQELLDLKQLEGAEDNALLYSGEHWNGGAFWVGPKLDGVTSDASAVLAKIEPGFCSKNVVREVVDRHRSGVVGREPQWSLVPRRPLKEDESPTTQEQTLIDEAEAALTDWWNDRDCHGVSQKAAAYLLHQGRGVIRVFVPPGLVNESGQLPPGDLTIQLGNIYVEAPDPVQACVHQDRATMQRLGIYSYTDDTKPGQAGPPRADVSFLDETGLTVVRVLGDAATAIQESKLDFGRHLLVIEAERDMLVTPQVRSNQKNMNRALTMMGRNSDLAGFVERTLLNAQLPGSFEGEGAERRYVPDTLLLGPGITNNIIGVKMVDAGTGKETIATPSVVYREPVSPMTFIETKNDHYRNILEETDQIHVLLAGDATSSGESRKQARQGFETSLMATKPKLDYLIRELIETALAMASTFAGQPARFAGLRAVAECRVDAGPKTSEENKETREQVNAGLLSKETGMSRLGVEDTDAELARIAAEKEADLSAGQQAVPLADPNNPDFQPPAQRVTQPPAPDQAAA